MKEKLKYLASAMAVLQEQQDRLKDLKARFDKENAELLRSIADRRDYIARLKSEIEPDAISEFKTTGEKKLSGGIGIREITQIAYNPDEVLQWAKDKDMFLVLDVKSFDKAAPSLNLDFVSITKQPKVTFPKLERLQKELAE
jgi:hypothetical protein